ncbi:MAG TPA: DUF349 domain-containing protein [Bacteroidales bacterium]|nr:DUF349 domain-containing protein [Bacteroidales bacterium]
MENKLNNSENTASKSEKTDLNDTNLCIENPSDKEIDNNNTDIIVTENIILEEKDQTEYDFQLPEENEMLDEEMTDIEASENNEKSSFESYTDLSKEDILTKLRQLIHETNVDETRKEIEFLKAQYYKKLKQEFDKLRQELKDSTGNELEIERPKDDTEDYLKELMADYKLKKAELAKKQEEQKVNNLKLKEEIIEKIKGLANSEESLHKTFAEFKSLQEEWTNIGPVPNSETNILWKNYQLQIERFYDLVKINKELRDLDFKRNLEQKIELCEKAEELLIAQDIIAAYRQLQEYHNLWKELGPVPHDKREEIWDRFSITSKKIRQAYQDHFEKIKQEHQANYEQKVILCEKAESIFENANPVTSKDWTELSEQVLELQKIWKTIGMVPSNVNTEIYERFRAACNKFFETKKEFYGAINEELNTNLQKKIELCISAESIKDNTDWKKNTELFLDLQKKWKAIGAVPKKNSEQIWKRFRAACDHFFDAKSAFYSNIDNEQKENLKKKEELIEEIKGFSPSSNQSDNIAKLKEFQSRWTEIGYVASSQKDRLYAEFKKLISELYDKMKVDRESLELNNFNSRIESLKGSGSIESLSRERSRILQQIQEKNTEILQIENNMGFFSTGSDSIIKEFKKKIEKAESEIKMLKDKKKAIDLAERELKKANDNNDTTN